MRLFVRRVRGIVLMGLTWAVVWALAGAPLVAAPVYWFMRYNPDFESLAVSVGLSSAFFAIYGFVIGALFAIALAIGERRRTIDQLKAWRVAAWGAVAGVAAPLINFVAVLAIEGMPLNNVVPVTIVAGLLGAMCAAGTLKIARSERAIPSARAAGAALPG